MFSRSKFTQTKGGVNEIIYLFNYEKQPSPKHVTTGILKTYNLHYFHNLEVVTSLLTIEVIFLLSVKIAWEYYIIFYNYKQSLQGSHSVEHERYMATYMYVKFLRPVDNRTEKNDFHNKAFTLRSLIFDIG